MSESLGDSRLNQRQRPFGGPVGIKRWSNCQWIEKVVNNCHPGVELALPHGDKALALAVLFGVPSVESKKVDHRGHAFGREDHLISRRLELGGIRRRPGSPGGDSPDRGALDLAQCRRSGMAGSGRSSKLVNPVQRGSRDAGLEGLACRVGKSHRAAISVARTGSLRALLRRDEVPGSRRSLYRRGPDGTSIKMARSHRHCGRGQPRPVGVGRSQMGGMNRLFNQRAQPLLIAPGGRGSRHFAVHRHFQLNGTAALGHVLMDERVGEAGQALVGAVDRYLSLGPVTDHPDHHLGKRSNFHPLTPTLTSRKRPALAGWPVWPICIG